MSSDWERLAARTVAVTALTVAGGTAVLAVPIVLAVAAGGRYGAAALAWAAAGVVLLTGAASVADLLRWRTTAYRLRADRLEVHQGVVVRRRRTLVRERIRTVDLSAHPLLRIFGLARLSVGTGDRPRSWVSPEVRWALGDEHVIVLDPLRRADAERLRSQLLDRSPADLDRSEDLLVAGRLGWARYAPLSVWTVVLAGIAVAITFQVADWFDAGARPVAVALDVADRIGAWSALTVIGAGVVLLGAVARLVLHLEAWWGYRFTRGAGSLLVRRGLLTTRSVTLDESRIRGAVLVQPLGARLSGGARVDVLATGLGADDITAVLPTTLLPVAPHTVARDVLRRVLPDLGSEHLDRLRPHPRAALARRLGRAAAASLVLVAAAATAQLLWWLTGGWLVVLALATCAGIVAVTALAVDSARALGHRLAPRHIITRRGSLHRTCAVLQRDGIIGWRIRQSVFQRRSGLVTVSATTVVGRGHQPVVDIGLTEGLALAARAVPGLLDRFLLVAPQRAEDRPPGADETTWAPW